MVSKKKLMNRLEKGHTHLMYHTPAGSWRCTWMNCKRANTSKANARAVIWSPTKEHAVVID